MTGTERLKRSFFIRDVLYVAPELIGKTLAIRSEYDEIQRFMITETEAYRGAEDKACHASRGRTARTEVMYREGGRIYVYFIYGMYWMLNFVAGKENEPQAALIRGIERFNGPGKLTKALKIDSSFYGEDLTASDRIWVEDTGFIAEIKTGHRIGISYAGDPWIRKPWRYYIIIKNAGADLKSVPKNLPAPITTEQMAWITTEQMARITTEQMAQITNPRQRNLKSSFASSAKPNRRQRRGRSSSRLNSC